MREREVRKRSERKREAREQEREREKQERERRKKEKIQEVKDAVRERLRNCQCPAGLTPHHAHVFGKEKDSHVIP